MKMRRLIALALTAILALTLVSCGYEPYSDKESGYYYDGTDYYVNGPMDGFNSSAPDEGRPSGVEGQGLYMTYRAYVKLETKEFDKCVEQLMEQVLKAGGYVSSMDVSGGNSGSSDRYDCKRGNYEIKIPSGELNSFIEGTSGLGNVITISQSSEDITSQYLDTQARLTSLEAQRERLTELMNKAASVSELLEIENQLSYVIYEIESYTSQMNAYKDMVAYSTVTVKIEEVAKLTVSEPTFLSRLGSAAASSWRDFMSVLGEIAIVLIYLLPFALFTGVVVLVILLLVRRKRKARREKENA